MAFNGNELIIALGGTPIACARSAQITNQCETIEIASASQNTFRKFIAGRAEWKVSVGRLVAAVSDVGTDLLRVRTTYTLAVVDRSNNIIVSGQAICTSADVQATRGSLATGSFQFQGTDALSTPT